MSDSLLKSLRPTYALINRENFSNNIKVARSLSGSDIIAVVKADGYGHGACEMAVYANKHDSVTKFGVATISEGMEIRNALEGGDVKITVLGYVDPAFHKEMVHYRIVPTLSDHSYAASFHNYLVSIDQKYPVFIKIDTGMNRLGFDYSLDLEEFSKKYPLFKIVHIMSHMSSSDSDTEYSTYQDKLFMDYTTKYAPLFTYSTSLFNSSAVAKYKNRYKYTRPGLMLYGYTHGIMQDIGLKPVMSIRSKITHIAKVKKGECISYNRTFKCENDTIVGVVPVGYADGYFYSLSNKGYMYVDNIKCKILGSVCMDMTMIDVTPFGEKAYGKEVEIVGKNINASEVAKLADSMDYEFLTGISDRIPRLYV